MVSPIAQKIKTRMTEKRHTVASLEREAGLKVHAVRNILLGKSKNPSADTLKAISIVLDCTVDDLLSDAEGFEGNKENKHNDLKIENPELFKESISAILDLFQENDKTPDYKDLSFLATEVYVYSIENNDSKLDEPFMKWLYSRDF